MNQSYFDQKFQALKTKLSATYFKELLKSFDNLPPKVADEYLPYLTIKLLELLNSIIVKLRNLKGKIEEPIQNSSEMENMKNSLTKVFFVVFLYIYDKNYLKFFEL